MIYSNSKRVGFERMTAEMIVLKDRIVGYQEAVKSLQDNLRDEKRSKKELKETHKGALAQKDAIIKELTHKLAQASAAVDRDGTNTGISTAATPINRKKVIPNTRRGSAKQKGGQPGHKRHTMTAFGDTEITDVQEHELNVAVDHCDVCHEELMDTEEVETKDEFDVRITVVKKRHNYHIYECMNCGARVRRPIERRLKEANQYGSNMQACALSLMVTGNVAINKVRMLINGITLGQMNPCEGFICKLYQRASVGLAEFMIHLKRLMVRRSLLYWDDTVIMIKTHRSCMRFYGDETISYYTAHNNKDLNGLLEDNVLPLLTEETTVMHDHNRVNYNEQFCFQNIECIQHLQRDLQKVTDDNPGHTWSRQMKELISLTIKERKERIVLRVESFTEEYLGSFEEKMKKLIRQGYKESAESTNPTTVPSENTLLTRIENYYDNYFRWIVNFRLPTTDNLSERGLRCVKSHLKISGQFENEKTASYYATVKSYVETCRKNQINEMDALSRLCGGNPYTVEEIFA